MSIIVIFEFELLCILSGAQHRHGMKIYVNYILKWVRQLWLLAQISLHVVEDVCFD